MQLQLFQNTQPVTYVTRSAIVFSELSIHEKINIRAHINIGFYPFSVWNYRYMHLGNDLLKRRHKLSDKWYAEHKMRRRDDWKE